MDDHMFRQLLFAGIVAILFHPRNTVDDERALMQRALILTDLAYDTFYGRV